MELALNSLVATGVLQPVNRMDINVLLNLEGESHMLTETSDEEICHTVMDLIKACEDIEINGGDDVDEDIPAEPCPTHHDVLKAVSTICKCIKDSNDPIAPKLDTLLGSFRRQLWLDETRNMKDTVSTNFFKRS